MQKRKGKFQNQPPLCKGRCHSEVVTGGIVFNVKLRDKKIRRHFADGILII